MQTEEVGVGKVVTLRSMQGGSESEEWHRHFRERQKLLFLGARAAQGLKSRRQHKRCSLSLSNVCTRQSLKSLVKPFFLSSKVGEKFYKVYAANWRAAQTRWWVNARENKKSLSWWCGIFSHAYHVTAYLSWAANILACNYNIFVEEIFSSSHITTVIWPKITSMNNANGCHFSDSSLFIYAQKSQKVSR